MINLQNKRVGIWGLGIVGTSVLSYVQRFTSNIQILDKKAHATVPVIIQTPQTIKDFLELNDIIIPSPGISLLGYQDYTHKFLHELDIFSYESTIPTIAITGTLGKTTITSFIHQCIPDSVAAGNIGYAMLNVLSLQPEPKTIVLELSSYQLQYAQAFAPDIALLTNFYPNHLDHHATIDEYLIAKCNIFAHQKPHQKALIPYELIEHIEQTMLVPSSVYLFCINKPTTEPKYPTFYTEANKLILSKNGRIITVLDLVDQLPNTTFIQNWIAIFAILYLYNISLQSIQLQSLLPTLSSLQQPQHRVEFVTNFHHVAVYDDSKSTLWQATQQAIARFPNKKIALFLGGLSKGTDRTPLIQYCQTQKITVFAFGKEADILSALCNAYHVPHVKTATMQQALDLFAEQYDRFDLLLFSPAGASFDLFKNFEDRGEQFKIFMHALTQKHC